MPKCKRFTKEAFARFEGQINQRKKDDKSSDEDSLPEINEEIMCSICLEEVLTDYVRLPCGHSFHRSCIIKWKKKKPQCPNCRSVQYYHCLLILRFSFAGKIAERTIFTRVSLRKMAYNFDNCTVWLIFFLIPCWINVTHILLDSLLYLGIQL